MVKLWKFHPKPQTKPISLRIICIDVIASRSQDINPWIDSFHPVCTIIKMQYKRLLKTQIGMREPTRSELSIFASFPLSFKWIGNKLKQWGQIGNSVPPNLMRAIAENIRQAPFMKDIKSPTVISLFAGCGGSSLGYQMAGFKELLTIEWDNNAVETFKLNFPDIPVYHDDIVKLTSQECMKLAKIKPYELDVLNGSPPCQGFSTAGKRKFNDPRNSLFKEYARLLNDLQPKVFIMENVTGMIKGVMKQAYLQIIKTLRECGYKAKGQVMNAMYYNVPQSRERVIIIGVRKDLKIEPEHPDPQNKPIIIHQVIEDLPEYQDKIINHIWIDESPDGKNTKTWKLADKCKQGKKYAGHQKRLIWNKVCPTLCKPSSDGMNIMPYLRNSHCHPLQTRTLSVRELARLSSYPDNFQFTKDLNGANRIGNSVPPNLMKAISEHIKTNILGKIK